MLFVKLLVPTILIVAIIVVIVGYVIIKCVADAEDNFRKD